HICNQKFPKSLPIKYVDTHRSKIALRVFGFLLKLDDLAGLIGVHDTEPACLPDGYLDDGDGCFGILSLMLGQHLGIIHLVDMVAGKDQKVIGTVIVNKVNVLGNSICGSAVNIQIGICFFTGRQNKNTAVLRVQSPTSSDGYIAVQKDGFILCEYADNIDTAVGAVT